MEQKTYLFDFDGTLVDSMPYWSEKMLNILREFRIPYPDNIIKIIAPLGDVGTAEYFRDTLGVPLTVEEMIERMDAYALDKYSNTIELKAGVYDYLQALKNAGCSINILTASPHRMVDPCLKRIGIYDLFDHIWSTEDFGKTKGDVTLFTDAAAILGRDVADVAFFDDNFYAISTAVKAQMYTVAVYDLSCADYEPELRRIADRYIESFEGMELV
jgi:HAD superfamily hydrolase (TIGR01509 family)